MIGVIGGSGLEKFSHEFRKSNIVFIPRHGRFHCPPHKINHKANLLKLLNSNVKEIIGVSMVGSLRKNLKPGYFAITSQFIDFTKTRYTFFEDETIHTPMTDPYDERISEKLYNICREMELPVVKGVTYVCVEGPRYETRAEIKMFSMLGGDVVGMTNAPEVILANELGIPYANLCLVTNMGAGLSDVQPSHEEVCKMAEIKLEQIKEVLLRYAKK